MLYEKHCHRIALVASDRHSCFPAGLRAWSFKIRGKRGSPNFTWRSSDVPCRLAHPSFYGQCGERRPWERERERKVFLHRKLTYYVLSHRSPKSRIVPLPLLHAAVITHHTTPWEKDNHPTISWQFVALLLPVSYFLYLPPFPAELW